jgi:hypothetical protein
MSFQHDDARLRVPKQLAKQLEKIAKHKNMTGRYVWGVLARKVLRDYVAAYVNAGIIEGEIE